MHISTTYSPPRDLIERATARERAIGAALMVVCGLSATLASRRFYPRILPLQLQPFTAVAISTIPIGSICMGAAILFNPSDRTLDRLLWASLAVAVVPAAAQDWLRTSWNLSTLPSQLTVGAAILAAQVALLRCIWLLPLPLAFHREEEPSLHSLERGSSDEGWKRRCRTYSDLQLMALLSSSVPAVRQIAADCLLERHDKRSEADWHLLLSQIPQDRLSMFTSASQKLYSSCRWWIDNRWDKEHDAAADPPLLRFISEDETLSTLLVERAIGRAQASTSHYQPMPRPLLARLIDTALERGRGDLARAALTAQPEVLGDLKRGKKISPLLLLLDSLSDTLLRNRVAERIVLSLLQPASSETPFHQVTPKVQHSPLDLRQTLRAGLAAAWCRNALKESADCILVVEGEEIRVHSALLEIHSPHFQRLFAEGFKESFDKRIELTGQEALHWKHLVEALYTGTIPDGVDLFSLGEIGHVYEFQWLANSFEEAYISQCRRALGDVATRMDVRFELLKFAAGDGRNFKGIRLCANICSHKAIRRLSRDERWPATLREISQHDGWEQLLASPPRTTLPRIDTAPPSLEGLASFAPDLAIEINGGEPIEINSILFAAQGGKLEEIPKRIDDPNEIAHWRAAVEHLNTGSVSSWEEGRWQELALFADQIGLRKMAEHLEMREAMLDSVETTVDLLAWSFRSTLKDKGEITSLGQACIHSFWKQPELFVASEKFQALPRDIKEIIGRGHEMRRYGGRPVIGSTSPFDSVGTAAGTA